jgi:predicted small secreted protein
VISCLNNVSCSCFEKQNLLIMKKIFLLAAATVSLVACSNTESNTSATNSDTSRTVTTTSTSERTAYAPSDGDVSRRNGKVMVRRNGDWVDADNDVRLDDGSTVNRNGRVVRDGNEVELQEGEVVNKTGRFFDKAGNAIEDAWDATKRGVKKAGDKIEDAVDGDKKH